MSFRSGYHIRLAVALCLAFCGCERQPERAYARIRADWNPPGWCGGVDPAGGAAANDVVQVSGMVVVLVKTQHGPAFGMPDMQNRPECYAAVQSSVSRLSDAMWEEVGRLNRQACSRDYWGAKVDGRGVWKREHINNPQSGLILDIEEVSKLEIVRLTTEAVHALYYPPSPFVDDLQPPDPCATK